MVPKRAVEVMSCQIARLLQLTQHSVIPVAYHVQRKVGRGGREGGREEERGREGGGRGEGGGGGGEGGREEERVGGRKNAHPLTLGTIC